MKFDPGPSAPAGERALELASAAIDEALADARLLYARSMSRTLERTARNQGVSVDIKLRNSFVLTACRSFDTIVAGSDACLLAYADALTPLFAALAGASK